MAFTRSIKDIIKYPPSELDSFELIVYEWIDNLNFTLNPKDYLDNADDYIQKAKEKFLNAGWYGDGEIELMWIPPFRPAWCSHFNPMAISKWLMPPPRLGLLTQRHFGRHPSPAAVNIFRSKEIERKSGNFRISKKRFSPFS